MKKDVLARFLLTVEKGIERLNYWFLRTLRQNRQTYANGLPYLTKSKNLISKEKIESIQDFKFGAKSETMELIGREILLYSEKIIGMEDQLLPTVSEHHKRIKDECLKTIEKLEETYIRIYLTMLSKNVCIRRFDEESIYALIKDGEYIGIDDDIEFVDLFNMFIKKVFILNVNGWEVQRIELSKNNRIYVFITS
jgi:hypothetical protein